MTRDGSYVTYAAIFFSSLLVAGCTAQIARADTPTFSSDLHLGDNGSQVLELELFLNTNGFPLAAKGPGSSGNETSYFGELTQNALSRFQAAYGLPATGSFGPLTRALVNILLSEANANEPNQPGTAATSASDDASTTPAWLAFFNAHAPLPGWIPGFGGGGAPPPVAQSASPAPVISDIASTTLANRATVTWTTDELSDSEVVYSMDTSYSASVYDPTMTTSHSITITGLTMGTVYHFEVVSTNSASTTATSTDQTFKTKTIE